MGALTMLGQGGYNRWEFGCVQFALGWITRWGGAVLWRDSCHTHLVLGAPEALGP